MSQARIVEAILERLDVRSLVAEIVAQTIAELDTRPEGQRWVDDPDCEPQFTPPQTAVRPSTHT